ncbi:MAG TPA: HD-GYP domain-containing protein [Actinomycetota bacterium]|nr:HD-GYP domain-containing protein [Actinomycetota bacterium]
MNDLERGGHETALRVLSEDPEAGSLHDQLKVFAREIGVLYSAERIRTRELELALETAREMYVATMRSLAHVVEAKDPTTRGHLDRTAHYGIALARLVDPALAERREVSYGFFLHDIGKVGIPESILCKAGPLTELEWIVMRSHPDQGARIVAPIPFMGEAVEIVRSHHERWDGGGYPRGLRGEEIPLAARIFAIADSFDAMTSDRPYRAAMSTEAAVAEIRAGSGTQFDPRCVEAFEDLIADDEAGFLLREKRLVPAFAAG